MSRCNVCPRKCNVNRESGVLGACNAPDSIKLAKACLHFGEEPCISGKRGSGTIFFSGCNLKCVFCQNGIISHESFGKKVSVERLAEIMAELEAKGAHNINFVTPTHYTHKIKDALSIYKPNIPLVYNSSGYEDISLIEEDIFDVYLFDLKFFSREKSLKYAGCTDYFEVASSVIKKACEIKGVPVFDREGMLTNGVIVRHLILPQSTNDAIKIIDWLNDSAPNICFSLMSQYLPMHRAFEYKELGRKISKREYEKVLNALIDTNFYKIYSQDLTSATDEYIPDFNLEGI